MTIHLPRQLLSLFSSLLSGFLLSAFLLYHGIEHAGDLGRDRDRRAAMRTMRTFLRALCSCVLGASTLSAQAVRGAVVARGTNQPVGGAVVLLLDAKGAQVAGTLSDSTGRFLLKAPAPGTYT